MDGETTPDVGDTFCIARSGCCSECLAWLKVPPDDTRSIFPAFLTNAVGSSAEPALPGRQSKMGGTERSWAVVGTIWVYSDREPQGGWHQIKSQMKSVGGCHQLPSARWVAPSERGVSDLCGRELCRISLARPAVKDGWHRKRLDGRWHHLGLLRQGTTRWVAPFGVPNGVRGRDAANCRQQGGWHRMDLRLSVFCNKSQTY